jgi:hypothetical protein
MESSSDIYQTMDYLANETTNNTPYPQSPWQQNFSSVSQSPCVTSLFSPSILHSSLQVMQVMLSLNADPLNGRVGFAEQGA